MKRSPMSRGKPRSWNSTLPRVSSRQGEKNRKRIPVRDAYRKAHPWCERCGNRMVDVHEPWTRKGGGPIDNPDNMMSVCRRCHDWIHEHRVESEKHGWLVKASRGPAWLAAGGRRQYREAA